MQWFSLGAFLPERRGMVELATALGLGSALVARFCVWPPGALVAVPVRLWIWPMMRLWRR